MREAPSTASEIKRLRTRYRWEVGVTIFFGGFAILSWIALGSEPKHTVWRYVQIASISVYAIVHALQTIRARDALNALLARDRADGTVQRVPMDDAKRAIAARLVVALDKRARTLVDDDDAHVRTIP